MAALLTRPWPARREATRGGDVRPPVTWGWWPVPSFHELPKPARIVLSLVAGVVIYVAVRVLPDLLFEEDSVGRWLYLGGVLVASLLLIYVAVRRQSSRVGGREQGRAYRRAFRTGEVPPEANRELWRAELERVMPQQRFGRFYLGGSAILMAMVALLSLGTAALADLSGGARIALAVLGLILGAGAAVIWHFRNLNHDRARRLAEKLDETPST